MLNRSLWHLFNVYITGYHLGARRLTIAGGVPGLVLIDSSERDGGNFGKEDGVSHDLVAPHLFLSCDDLGDDA